MVIEDTEVDLYVAIDRATDRVGRALSRRLARQREFAPGMSAEPESADGAAQIDMPPAAPHP